MRPGFSRLVFILCSFAFLWGCVSCGTAIDSADQDAGRSPIPLDEGWSYCWERSPGDCDEDGDFLAMYAAQWPGQLPGRASADVLWYKRAGLPAGIASGVDPGLFFSGAFLHLRVYLDDREIYRFGRVDPNTQRRLFSGVPWHFAPLPPDARSIAPAAQTLRVRVESTHPIFLGIVGRVWWLERSELWRRMLRNDLDELVLAILFFAAGLLAFVCAIRFGARLFAPFACAAISIGVAAVCATGVKQIVLDAPLFWNLLQFPAMFFFAASIALFFEQAVFARVSGGPQWQFVLGRALPAVRRTLLAWLCLAWPAFLPVVEYEWRELYRFAYVWLPAILLTALVGLVGAGVLRFVWSGDRRARIAAVGLAALIVSRMRDAIAGGDVLRGDEATIFYGMFCLLGTGVWLLLDAYGELSLRARRAERAYFEAGLRHLRDRMKPHFLLNALNALYILARKADRGAVAAGILNLAEEYRHILERGVEDLVDFADEWEFARRYLETQQLRFADRLQFDMRMQGSPRGHRIPPLTLQPILENAVEHGLAPRPGGGRILVRVRFHRSADGDPRWWMIVRDNGVGSRVDSQSIESAGSEPTVRARRAPSAYAGETLSNIRLRLRHLLRNGGLWIRAASGEGTVVVLTGGPPGSTSPANYPESLS